MLVALTARTSSRLDSLVLDFAVQVVHHGENLLHGRVLCRVVDAELVSTALHLRDEVVQGHEPVGE